MQQKLNSLEQSLTATRPTSHNENSKNKKGAITFAARRHNVNVLLSNSTLNQLEGLQSNVTCRKRIWWTLKLPASHRM